MAEIRGRRAITRAAKMGWTTCKLLAEKSGFPMAQIGGIWTSDSEAIARWKAQRIERKSMEKEIVSVAVALPKEIERVRELISMYRDPLLGGSGELAARLMVVSIENAEKAIAASNVVEMVRSLQDLRGFNE